MSTRPYFILRESEESNRTKRLKGGLLSAEATNSGRLPILEVSRADLSNEDCEDIGNDPRTVAMAEPMPMKLVEPTATADVTSATGCPSNWGVEAVGASNSKFTGEGVVVAVLDTGIDPEHPAFLGIDIEQKNFTSDVDHDVNGHGTHCAGVIFGRDVDGARIGVAQGVTQAKIAKVLGDGGGSSEKICESIIWAVQNRAHVISMSLGFDFPGLVRSLVDDRGLKIEPATSIALEQYLDNVNLFEKLTEYVRALGSQFQPTLIVAASGNESDRPSFAIAAAPPAASSGILSVGALERGTGGLTVARYSNTRVTVCAPGTDIVSAYPSRKLRSMDGTSMAAPHVAGVAALWAEKLIRQSGDLDAVALKSNLIANATIAPLNRDAKSEDVGQGIIQAPQS